MNFSYVKSIIKRELHIYKGLLGSSNKKDIGNAIIRHIKGNFSKTKNIIFKSHLEKRKTLKFEIHLTTHCNLNCKCCDTFSGISPVGFAPLDQLKKDLLRLSEISGNKIECILLAGGEPLLYPDLFEVMNMIGENFYDVKNKQIITNGILLENQGSKFWESCKKNDFKLYITKYPININYDKIYEIAVSHGVYLEYYGITGSSAKTMRKIPLSLTGSENAKKSFKMCTKANNCITLKDGKLYTCSLIPRIDIFNNFFSKNLTVTEYDFVDIYKVKDIEEILEFLCKAPTFCRYCKTKKPVFGLEWQKTEKKIDEWT